MEQKVNLLNAFSSHGPCLNLAGKRTFALPDK